MLAGFLALAVLLSLGACGGASDGGVEVSSTRADGAKLSADDREAAEFVRSKLEGHWVQGPDGWTTELVPRNLLGQVMDVTPDVQYHQYRTLKFSVTPEELSEAQRLNGADYRGRVELAPTPERYFRTTATFEGPEGWSPWQDAVPAFALAVERRNGEWLIQDDALFEGIRPDPAAVPRSP